MAQYELNLLDYWLIIKKHKYTILFTAVLVLVATFVLTQFLKPIPLYEATARVKFARATTVANLMLESVSYNSEYDLVAQPDVIRSFPVIERAAKELDMLPADATS
ncbi:MAG: hypothetical protein IH787_08435, partial [Nitrospirae bacterium]|nr:hypothetical protein [Nitrospirota bacterium]